MDTFMIMIQKIAAPDETTSRKAWSALPFTAPKKGVLKENVKNALNISIPSGQNLPALTFLRKKSLEIPLKRKQLLLLFRLLHGRLFLSLVDSMF